MKKWYGAMTRTVGLGGTTSMDNSGLAKLRTMPTNTDHFATSFKTNQAFNQKRKHPYSITVSKLCFY